MSRGVEFVELAWGVEVSSRCQVRCRGVCRGQAQGSGVLISPPLLHTGLHKLVAPSVRRGMSVASHRLEERECQREDKNP